jgi:hypothetical protein
MQGLANVSQLRCCFVSGFRHVAENDFEQVTLFSILSQLKRHFFFNIARIAVLNFFDNFDAFGREAKEFIGGKNSAVIAWLEKGFELFTKFI